MASMCSLPRSLHGIHFITSSIALSGIIGVVSPCETQDIDSNVDADSSIEQSSQVEQDNAQDQTSEGAVASAEESREFCSVDSSPELLDRSFDVSLSGHAAAATTSMFTVTVTDSTTSEDGGTATVKIRLRAKPRAKVTLHFALNDNEGTLSKKTLVFASLNWSTDQVVTITGINDSIVDGSVEYRLVFLDANSSDSRFDRAKGNALPPPVLLTNEDNEYGIVGLRSSGNPGEWGSSVPVSFKLSRRPTANVTFAIKSENTNEGTLTSSTLTWQPSEWNIAKSVQLRGVHDEAPDSDPGYMVSGKATSVDPKFNNAMRSIAYATFDDDWEMRAQASDANPFAVSTFSDAGNSGTKLSFAAYPDQTRYFRNTINDNNYLRLRVLLVNVRSSYTHALTDEQIAREEESHAKALNMLVHASYRKIMPERTTLTLETHLDQSMFKTGNALDPNCPAVCNAKYPADEDKRLDCLAACPRYHFIGNDQLGQEIARFYDPSEFDLVHVNLPYDDGVVDGNEGAGMAWARVVGPAPLKWYDGRATYWWRANGTSTPNPDVYFHEIVHQLQWALNRSGSPETLNLHNDFYQAFPTRTSSESRHWNKSGSQQGVLRATIWFELAKWLWLPSGSPVPMGERMTRSGEYDIKTARVSSTEIRQYRQKR